MVQTTLMEVVIDELRREIAIPFRADEVPLVRAKLLHQREYGHVNPHRPS